MDKTIKSALVIGGNSGIGLALMIRLLERGCETVYCVGKDPINEKDIEPECREEILSHIVQKACNLVNENYDFLTEYQDVDALIYTAGFGRVAEFSTLTEMEMDNAISVNLKGAMHAIRAYYGKIRSATPFYCAVMGSIAGHIASPLFSVYGATKSGLCAFMENLNVELAHDGIENRILDVSPGSIKGSNFSGGGNHLAQLYPLADEILDHMLQRETVYIPDYDSVYRGVIERYQKDPMQFGVESYDYKTPRISDKPQGIIGYLSGTFDLFHIGHLNLLRRAKEQCDYLIVGVHKDGSWKGKETFIPFEERVAILRSIRYVDKVVPSFPEDSDAYDAFGIHRLFVGSDYLGTERFRRYEEYFADKDVKIVYFPYTKGTSSTQLREALEKK